MKYTGSLDSNVLLRLIVGDLPDQAKVAEDLIANGKDFAVSDTAFIEVMFVLERHYQYSRSEIKKAIKYVMRHPKVHSKEQIISETLELFSANTALSPEDCYLAIKAKNYNALPLWTFDKKLAKQSSGLARLVDSLG